MSRLKLSDTIKVFVNGAEIKPKVKLKNPKRISYLERYIKAVILSNNNCEERF